VVIRKSVKERIKRPTNPEVLFDILLRRSDSPGGAEEHVAPVFWSGLQEF
jgi:hypothetical protein